MLIECSTTKLSVLNLIHNMHAYHFHIIEENDEETGMKWQASRLQFTCNLVANKLCLKYNLNTKYPTM